MRKTRDRFKTFGEIKGTFSVRMGTIKDRNGKDITEHKRLRRGGKNRQNYTKRVLMTRVTTMLWSLI